MRRTSCISLALLLLISAVTAGMAAAEEFAIYSVPADQASSVGRYWTKSRLKKARACPTPKIAGNVQQAAHPSRSSQGASGLDPGSDPSVKTLLFEQPLNSPAASTSSADVPSEGYKYPPPHTTSYVLNSLYGTASTPYPYKVIGKLFFVDDEGDEQYCSASVIGGRAILTAGHCISNGKGTYFTKIAFVPAYNDGKEPFGKWVYASILTFEEWHNNMDWGRDVAFVTLQDQEGKTISETVGSLGFAYNQDRVKHFSMFGYPADKPWDGENMVETEASYASRDTWKSPDATGIGTSQTGGCSGGPWITGFAPGAKGARNVAGGVNSYSVEDEAYQIFSPYFDTRVKELKDKAVPQ